MWISHFGFHNWYATTFESIATAIFSRAIAFIRFGRRSIDFVYPFHHHSSEPFLFLFFRSLFVDFGFFYAIDQARIHLQENITVVTDYASNVALDEVSSASALCLQTVSTFCTYTTSGNFVNLLFPEMWQSCGFKPDSPIDESTHKQDSCGGREIRHKQHIPVTDDLTHQPAHQISDLVLFKLGDHLTFYFWWSTLNPYISINSIKNRLVLTCFWYRWERIQSHDRARIIFGVLQRLGYTLSRCQVSSCT